FETDAGKGIPEAKIREILRTGRRSVKTSKGATVAISREIPELIEPLLADLGIPTREGQIQLDRARDLILQNFRKKDLNIWETNEEKWSKLPALSTELRAYQKDGAVWLIERLQQLSGALLADEMGLGKTVQTLTAVRFFRTERSAPCLVLVPTSLLANWQAEFERWTPDLRVLCLHGPGRDEKRDELGKSDVVLTSYGTLCRDLAFHLKQDYGLLVADEASLLRNPDSETSRAVAKLKASKRLALTGTPVENRLRDLWAIFRLIAPGYLGARKEFEERYEALDDSADRRRLRLRIAPFVLRRTKAEVAKDLPEKAIIDEWIQLDAESRQTYASLARAGLRKLESMEDQPRQARMHLLTLLLRLRQLCLDPRLVDEQAEAGAKTRRLHELLTERAESGAKTLVFSQFRKYLGLASRDLDGSCGRIYQLDGSTRNRGDLIREFEEHDGPAVFLISLKAGGYGLNLTAADAVIHMDPWWNPAVEAQASDRAHRIGQTQPVTVYRLLARDSVEERVRRLQQAKQSVISSFNDGSAPNNWSETDLRGLVEGA
ncbi:MAG: DEAD/DEAH box helicase, partial [Verrucomicrobiota bacterium]